jgi:hypothetical protein
MANQKLWLWSRTPFDSTLYSGPSYSQWIAAKAQGYPCAALTEPAMSGPSAVTSNTLILSRRSRNQTGVGMMREWASS